MDVDLSKLRNPVLEGHYADPELRVHDGRFWLFPTTSTQYDDQVAFDAFVSDDLVTWTKVPSVLRLKDVPWSSQRAAWAPSVVSRYGSMFMYFSSGDGDGIGLAVWNRAFHRFVEPLGRPLVREWPFGAQPIDAQVFVDDSDGGERAYLYFGGHGTCVAIGLKPDMNSLDGDFVQVTPAHYVEGPFMFKRRGQYYFTWSEGGWGDDSYCIAYARAESPFGPFEREGLVLKGDPAVGTGAGHGCVLNIPGTDDWVISYHRRQPGVTARDARVTCIDRLLFDEDGAIVPVVLT